MTSHYQMLTLLGNTLMQQNLGECYNSYWAVLSTVNRNKVLHTMRVLINVLCFFIDIFSISLGYVEYIQTIMMMEESVQHVVMTAIQEVQ